MESKKFKRDNWGQGQKTIAVIDTLHFIFPIRGILHQTVFNIQLFAGKSQMKHFRKQICQRLLLNPIWYQPCSFVTNLFVYNMPLRRYVSHWLCIFVSTLTKIKSHLYYLFKVNCRQIWLHDSGKCYLLSEHPSELFWSVQWLTLTLTLPSSPEWSENHNQLEIGSKSVLKIK